MSNLEYKAKLSIDEQIEDLDGKGVRFDIYDKEYIKKYLQYQNYYFKFKSFEKNYSVNPKDGKYVNLDVAYLVELSSIDFYLRKIILEMCLDIEHYLKTRFLKDICENELEDGYVIVRTFMQSDKQGKIQLTLQNEASGYSICKDLAEKYKDNPEKLAAWNVVELLPFGAFVDLYSFYYNEMYPKSGREHYCSYLGSVKFLRNAAAHNNPLLSSLRKPRAMGKFKKTRELCTSLNEIKSFNSLEHRDSMMSNPVLHDFVALLFVYFDVLRFPALREKRDKKISEIYEMICSENGIFLKNRVYFSKNKTIVDSYHFISEVCKILENRTHSKMKGKKVLSF